MNIETFAFEPGTKSIQDILNYYENDQLELSPPFQRDSVWTQKDREKLIDSILSGYPLPSIFLYERSHGNGVKYDVIDGKQRLESILMFTGAMRGRFAARLQLPESEREWLDWRRLVKRGLAGRILTYRLPVNVVRGQLAHIIELFVRINSTGKALSAAEKRHARYYNNVFLKTAGRLASRLAARLQQQKILGPTQISRMKHVELVCELMLSAHKRDLINKKATIDGVMASNEMTDRQVKVAAERTFKSIRRVLNVLPSIRATRFKNVSDFYSLVVLFQKFEAEGLVLTNRRANRRAGEILTAFGAGVDEVRLATKKGFGARPDQELFRSYLETVLEGTDEINHRRQREAILRGLLESLFGKRDDQRLFSPEQRRLLWASADERRCKTCKKALSWDDLTIDHINPHSKGGRTELRNAALMCRQHNSAKGNRRAA